MISSERSLVTQRHGSRTPMCSHEATPLANMISDMHSRNKRTAKRSGTPRSNLEGHWDLGTEHDVRRARPVPHIDVRALT